MPKVNVYLPDDLAETVKDLNIPVSAICQRALEGSVKRIAAIRAVKPEDLVRGSDRIESFTQRAKDALRLAVEAAGGQPSVTSEHLVEGLLREGGNLALDVLQAIDIDPATLRHTSASEGAAPAGLAADAANALELAVVEAIALGHNYVGCEHLLLGLVAEPEGAGGQVLRDRGADLKSTRRAVQTALAGIVHLKKQQQSTPDAAKVLEMIMSRLARLERHAGIG
ncbi:Clp protease N-terminal domain-containing protein [Lentzea sp. NPDC042327]|uniref:Clp protease N-terminal domain-containing protein n=1 Tax=Lentzea sp. NPDC042327 TaxID=3154801 RepID=UPI0033ECD784